MGRTCPLTLDSLSGSPRCSSHQHTHGNESTWFALEESLTSATFVRNVRAEITIVQVARTYWLYSTLQRQLRCVVRRLLPIRALLTSHVWQANHLTPCSSGCFTSYTALAEVCILGAPVLAGTASGRQWYGSVLAPFAHVIVEDVGFVDGIIIARCARVNRTLRLQRNSVPFWLAHTNCRSVVVRVKQVLCKFG